MRCLLPAADIWSSVAGIWEIIARVQVGKLILSPPVGDYLAAKLVANGVSVLSLSFAWKNCLRIIVMPSIESSLLRVSMNCCL